MDKQVPTVVGNIHLDEVFYKVKGKDVYRWSAKDKATKYRLYGHLTKKRDYENGAKLLFQHIKRLCYPQFILRKNVEKKIRFVTDKLAAYKRGFNKFFRTVALLTHGVPIKGKRAGLKHNNNCIERDHQYSKQRYKTMRGFKDFESSDDLLNFFDVYYNFINKQKIRRKMQTPAEAARMKSDLGESYKLLRLIERAYDES